MNFKKMFCSAKTKFQKGVTMLEMLLVLSIIAILLILATRYYVSTSYSQKVSQLHQEITAIQAATANWKNSNPTLTGLSINGLYQAGYLAKADLEPTAQASAVSPWGEVIRISPAAASGYATIEYTATTTAGVSACIAIADSIRANISDSASTASCSGKAGSATGTLTYTFAP